MKKFRSRIKVMIAGGVLAGCILAVPVMAETELETPQYPELIAEGIRSLAIEKNGEAVFEVSYVPQEGKESWNSWAVTAPYQTEVSVNSEAMYELFRAVAALDLTESASADVPIPENGEDTVRIEVKYFAEQQEDAPGQIEATAMYELNVWQAEEKYFGYLTGYEDQVFSINKGLVDQIVSVNPFDLILKISHLISVDSIREFSAQSGEKNLTLTISEDGKFLKNGEETEEKTFHNLYIDFMSVMVEQEAEPDTGKENAEPILTLTYKRNSSSLKDIVVEYYEQDDTFCSVSVDGHEEFLVLKDEVQKLIDEIDA